MYRLVGVLIATTLTGAPVADTTGDDYEVKPKPESRGESIKEPKWAILWKLTNAGGTSPTSEILIDCSNDGTNWFRRSISATCSGATTAQGLTEFVPTKFIRPYIDVGGSAAPTSVAVRAELVCTYGFETEAVI